MYKLIESYIVNYSGDNILIYDVIENIEEEFNISASMIFKNINKSISQIFEIYKSTFDHVPDDSKDIIENFKNLLVEKYFYYDEE